MWFIQGMYMYIWYHRPITPDTKKPRRKDTGIFPFMFSQKRTTSSKILKGGEGGGNE